MQKAEIPVVILTGTPHQRGVAHGIRFRDHIARVLAHDVGALPAAERSAAGRRAVAAFDAIRETSPETAEEIEGIAEGACQSVPDIVLRSGFELLKPNSDSGCSAIALKTKAGAIAAQNWDAPVHKHSELALFLHFSRSAFEFAVVASFGGLGWAGMNSAGLALVNNDLILNGCAAGIPSQVVRRIVFAMADVASAAAALAALPHMGGRSYLIGDRRGEIAAAEVSANGGAYFLPAAEAHLHTNNSLLPETRRQENQDALRGIYPSSAARLAALQCAFTRESLSVEGVKRVLCDETGAPNAVCKTASPEEPTETAFSIIMDCGHGEIHLASGRPSVSSYRRVLLPKVF
ncbi:C45 family autoproteolytic acyltransferase/hydolase [Bradyrhizobium cajani]|uniref:Acyl-CoA-6-aminopenicillanic acid acyltransferase n=1 Tax=Bradyrhizobium cajani TaxID=1928661 RepID=A0A844TPA3_9BRAD|nr:C45 family peptidase [Bradyrhizobium cajani]MCP3371810.1 C45 family peptidase [Bradyrhizobium cajani]MVT76370.1 acyl-CoA-6-aminopenicillanic acid acyltransferase [Bradyrhizobium cajani]